MERKNGYVIIEDWKKINRKFIGNRNTKKIFGKNKENEFT